jgi:hypothetical protein
MLRFSLYAMTQPMQFTIFTPEILANQFESSALVAGKSVRAVCRRRCRQAAFDH